MHSPRAILRALPLLGLALFGFSAVFAAEKPNIVIILADDLGYGDVSCYGAKKIATPNIDRLARDGRRFTDAHATSATCTPSRYALLTGEYPWRRADAKILPGNAPLLISPDSATLPKMLQHAGYTTCAVGKWHLGLGGDTLDWNGDIKPGPCEIGFSTCFIMPATGDRVPCVYLQDHRIVGLDPTDPLAVDYAKKIGQEPTGKDHPELLKYPPSHGHADTIVNGISRIGFMSGGKAAWWKDEDMADTLTKAATGFIEKNKDHPFFLYFATHDVHVPRLPNQRFVGKSGLGLRGDAVLEFDWSVGAVLDTLDRLHLADNTLVIVTSDNGPVVDDGYVDGSVEHLDGHTPGGPLRGGKYSAFEAGTRVPLVVRWPKHVKPGVTSALVSQVDFHASFAALTGEQVPASIHDSQNQLPALLGTDDKGRNYVVEHAANGRLGITHASWKYIVPGPGPKLVPGPKIETGYDTKPQLYDLTQDIGEKNNVAEAHPEIVAQLKIFLAEARGTGPVADAKNAGGN